MGFLPDGSTLFITLGHVFKPGLLYVLFLYYRLQYQLPLGDISDFLLFIYSDPFLRLAPKNYRLFLAHYGPNNGLTAFFV